MILSRRNLLASGAAVATVAAVGGSRFTASAPPALVVYDSRRTDSRAFARSIAAPRIDIAREDANFWRAVRSVGEGNGMRVIVPRRDGTRTPGYGPPKP